MAFSSQLVASGGGRLSFLGSVKSEGSGNEMPEANMPI